jgi:putative ABC transport system permease protein
LGYLVPTAVISPVTAKRLGIKTAAASSFLFDTTRMPTQSEQQRATAIAAGVGLGVYFENGFHYNVTTGLFVLLGISALVTLAATAIATVLAGAEARADLATLAAVGAAPRTRRILSMGQAASVAGLGALLGVLAGLVPVIAVVQASSGFPLVIPWLPIAGSVIGVPLLASLIAGLFTRSRLPVQRRLA